MFAKKVGENLLCLDGCTMQQRVEDTDDRREHLNLQCGNPHLTKTSWYSRASSECHCNPTMLKK